MDKRSILDIIQKEFTVIKEDESGTKANVCELYIYIYSSNNNVSIVIDDTDNIINTGGISVLYNDRERNNTSRYDILLITNSILHGKKK